MQFAWKWAVLALALCIGIGFETGEVAYAFVAAMLIGYGAVASLAAASDDLIAKDRKIVARELELLEANDEITLQRARNDALARRITEQNRTRNGESTTNGGTTS